MRIVKYPHPTLRHKSKPLRRVDKELTKLIREMFDLLYEHRGIGLAANQVDLPYRLFVINLESDPAKKDCEYVLINPVVTQRKGMEEKEEGCLSFPEIYAPVLRPEKVTVAAYNLSGQEVHYDASGLFARAVQHELDHLDGVQFIDRLSDEALAKIKPKLTALECEYREEQGNGAIPADDLIAARLTQLEQLRT